MKKLLLSKKGTSLVELLAVIVIMGIIAAIAVPSVGALITNTKKKAAVEQANVVTNSAATFLTTQSAQNTSVNEVTAEELYQTYHYIDKNPFSGSVTFKLLENGSIEITLDASGVTVDGYSMTHDASGWKAN